MTIRKCLFPAAGYGTRFLPATKAMPKEMLPIVDKPLIQYGVEEALAAGLTEIAIVTGRGKRAIEDHFDTTSYELERQLKRFSKEQRLASIERLVQECTFSYTRQKEMLGLGDAVRAGRTLIGAEPFAVLLADDLCIGNGKGVLAKMCMLFRKYHRCIVAVEEVDRESVSNYGIVEGSFIEDHVMEVSGMVEKPDPAKTKSNLAIIGRYILTPEVFEILRTTKKGVNDEIQLTDALNELARAGNMLAYKIEGTRFDCGNVDGFVAATNWCNQERLRKINET